MSEAEKTIELIRSAAAEAARRSGMTLRPIAPEEFGESTYASGSWFEVTSVEDLIPPLLARFDKNAAGRLMLTGLVLGHDRSDITARRLRDVRVGALLSAASGWDLGDPDAIEGETFEQAKTRLGPEGLEADAFVALVGAAQWLTTHESAETVDSMPPRRGVAPSEDLLQNFARLYLINLQTQPRRAMTATAKQMFIDRSTANRYAKLCRDPERAYLPPREK